MIALTEAQQDAIEAAYWEFDGRRGGLGIWREAPQSERDAFKAVMRNMLANFDAITGAAATIKAKGFYLAAFHHSFCDRCVLWWRPERKGYTPDLAQAGIYTADEAAKLEDPMEAVLVPVGMLTTARIRRTLDVDDTPNVPYRSPEALRQAVKLHTMGVNHGGR